MWGLGRTNLDISVIIVNWNTKELLLNCLESVFETVRGIDFEVWLVDNASNDGSVKAAKEKYSSINVIQNQENLGFAAANNLAFKLMNGRYALLLNTDAILTGEAAKDLYDFMEVNSEAGIACGQLLNQDGSKQNSIANFPSLLSLLSNETLLRILFPKKFPSKRKEYSVPLEIDSGIGACMIVRKKAIEEVGFFDESYFFFFEETDLAYRMRRSGWKVYFVPKARIFHIQGKSIGGGAKGRVIYYRSRYIFFKKWLRRSYNLIRVVVFMRLLVNTFLTLLGVLCTLGYYAPIRSRLIVYFQLILWHLRGCP
jgi:GT2 family glycosyltransferase